LYICAHGARALPIEVPITFENGGSGFCNEEASADADLVATQQPVGHRVAMRNQSTLTIASLTTFAHLFAALHKRIRREDTSRAFRSA